MVPPDKNKMVIGVAAGISAILIIVGIAVSLWLCRAMRLRSFDLKLADEEDSDDDDGDDEGAADADHAGSDENLEENVGVVATGGRSSRTDGGASTGRDGGSTRRSKGGPGAGGGETSTLPASMRRQLHLNLPDKAPTTPLHSLSKSSKRGSSRAACW